MHCAYCDCTMGHRKSQSRIADADSRRPLRSSVAGPSLGQNRPWAKRCSALASQVRRFEVLTGRFSRLANVGQVSLHVRPCPNPFWSGFGFLRRASDSSFFLRLRVNAKWLRLKMHTRIGLLTSAADAAAVQMHLASEDIDIRFSTLFDLVLLGLATGL